jgi:hypothetical protein
MTKGATVIVSLALVWGAGCGTKSAIGNLGTGGAGNAGIGGSDGGLAGHEGIGGSGSGGDVGILGGSGAGGSGTGGKGTGGNFSCPDRDAGPPPLGVAKAFALQPPMDYPTGGGAFGVATGDLNGDGKLDLVLLDRTVGLRFLYNNGNGTFAGPIDNPTNTSPGNVALGDINGDHRVDIVTIGNGGVSIYINQGNGHFAPPVTYVAGSESEALALGDLNRDGRLDIAVANAGDPTVIPQIGNVGMMLNTGSGTFSVTTLPGATAPTAIAIGDLSPDCNLDLVVAGSNGLTVLRGDSHQPATYVAGTLPSSIAIGDINADGHLDLIESSGYDSNAVAYTLLNYGDGTFTAPVSYVRSDTADAGLPNGANQVALADMNGDGIDDLLAASSCCGLSVGLNHGDGTFAAPIDYPVSPGAVSLAHGDFNGDGLVDVAVVNSDYNAGTSLLRVFMNASH